jgi:hypothetical protein
MNIETPCVVSSGTFLVYHCAPAFPNFRHEDIKHIVEFLPFDIRRSVLILEDNPDTNIPAS